eukprot:13479269-Alexandrium_andersonii.AAC.1
MSASLVGSEMCIRDSLSPQDEEPANAEAAPGVDSSGLAAGARLASRVRACLLYTSDAADDM